MILWCTEPSPLRSVLAFLLAVFLAPGALVASSPDVAPFLVALRLPAAEVAALRAGAFLAAVAGEDGAGAAAESSSSLSPASKANGSSGLAAGLKDDSAGVADGGSAGAAGGGAGLAGAASFAPAGALGAGPAFARRRVGGAGSSSAAAASSSAPAAAGASLLIGETGGRSASAIRLTVGNRAACALTRKVPDGWKVNEL